MSIKVDANMFHIHSSTGFPLEAAKESSRMNLSIGLLGSTAMFLLLLCDQCYAAPEATLNLHHRSRSRPLLIHGRYPVDELLTDDEDVMEVNKRQQFDDYGHMRFGKRGDQFDDYGHMRFGRSHE